MNLPSDSRPAVSGKRSGGLWRRLVLNTLSRLEEDGLRLVDQYGVTDFGSTPSSDAVIDVRDQRFYRWVVFGGALGAADAYIRGFWDAPDLTQTLAVLARNAAARLAVENKGVRLLRPLRAFRQWLKRNTRQGSRRNIAAHYDLSNEFFALMLDPTMTYSSGVFPTDDSTLESASREKYDRICRKLKLTRQDHVLEIGTGWGGFAEHAASEYGCRITTTTISARQHDYARERLTRAGLTDRVTLLRKDYRDLQGAFDKLVSIEMIEAVGEKYLPHYFAKCAALVKDGGQIAIQAIHMPDARYQRYRRSVDFIQRYIFPGGFLPSVSVMSSHAGTSGNLAMRHFEELGPHYARTLRCWRKNLSLRLVDAQRLGFDDRFFRTWHYYLCYCEAGFQERQVGLAQIIFDKPA